MSTSNNNHDDLLDFKVETGGSKSMSDIFAQSKTAFENSKGNVDVQAKILNATLESVTQTAEANKSDLKTQLDQLYEFLESIGIQFEGFKKLNDEETKLIDKAKGRKASADDELNAAEAALKVVEDIPAYSLFSPSTWWKSKKLAKANARLTAAKTEQTNSIQGIKDAEDTAETLFRARLDKADMKQAMDHIAFITQKAIDQIINRENEINSAEEELLTVLEAGNKTHLKALRKKEDTEVELEKSKGRHAIALQELQAMTDQNSDEAIAKKQEVRTIELEIQNYEAVINTCMAIAESKNSFEKKHSLTLKTLTSQKGNLRAMRGKLKSDLEARASYYEAYLTIMKAGNDQKLSDILEKIGVKTDEGVASAISEMYVASNKTRQAMMEAIPQHNQYLRGVLQALNIAGAEIDKKDSELKKAFEDFNRDSVHKEFETYGNDDKSGDGGDKKTTTTGTTADLLD